MARTPAERVRAPLNEIAEPFIVNFIRNDLGAVMGRLTAYETQLQLVAL